MRKDEIVQVLQMAYKRYSENLKIPSNVNVAAFLINAADWDLELKINLYFATKKQIEETAKELFNNVKK